MIAKQLTFDFYRPLLPISTRGNRMIYPQPVTQPTFTEVEAREEWAEFCDEALDFYDSWCKYKELDPTTVSAVSFGHAKT